MLDGRETRHRLATVGDFHRFAALAHLPHHLWGARLQLPDADLRHVATSVAPLAAGPGDISRG